MAPETESPKRAPRSDKGRARGQTANKALSAVLIALGNLDTAAVKRVLSATASFYGIDLSKSE